MTIPNYWRAIPQRYRLEAGRCSSCGQVYFPPRRVCRKCRSTEFETITLARDGRLVTWTVIRVAPTGFEDQSPYAVGIIELDDGVRILSQITDCEEERLREGLPLRLEFRKVSEDGLSGVIRYGYKAVPVE